MIVGNVKVQALRGFWIASVCIIIANISIARPTLAGEAIPASWFAATGPHSTAVFAGVDRNNRVQLWVTDGATASEPNVKNTYAGSDAPGLLNPAANPIPDITVLRNSALFAGWTAQNTFALWVTNGTAAATKALAIQGANSAGIFYGLFPSDPDFCKLGNDLIFQGSDSNFAANLWVTNGTSSGTHEIVIPGIGGLLGFDAVPDLTRLGNKCLFVGSDPSSDAATLWITNGTAAGTQQLLVNAPNHIEFYGDFGRLAPDFTVLGKRALFAGEGGTPFWGLWITNGTSAGTHELSPAGASDGGIFVGPFQPVTPDFTVLGSRALFEGEDANGNINVWVTDGTSPGTVEVNSSSTNSGGIFIRFETELNAEFTVLGSKAVFQGVDSRGHVNLMGDGRDFRIGIDRGGRRFGRFVFSSNRP